MSAKLQKIETNCECYLVTVAKNKMNTSHVFKFRINTGSLFEANPNAEIKVAIDAQSEHLDFANKKTIQGRGIGIRNTTYRFVHFGGGSTGASDIINSVNHHYGSGFIDFEITATTTTVSVIARDSSGGIISNESLSMPPTARQASEASSGVLMYLDAHETSVFSIDKIYNAVT